MTTYKYHIKPSATRNKNYIVYENGVEELDIGEFTELEDEKFSCEMYYVPDGRDSFLGVRSSFTAANEAIIEAYMNMNGVG